ncbi:hypothetical protein SP15_231 [Bacillus phage SP-15]|uniref:Uncharacterized protein n=1 Tax=Bacillus phage SP-15 TaxID=1792032 RepID=A0A127AWW2_9CAUD|nr:hypothetical protein SP15_231 [Bacillus phage SP-15]AMM45033.1 hypothetical protein SP15_231 [Bacillus phage SP-15]
MLFGLFESKSEKTARLEKHDLEQELRRREAKKDGLPFFGSVYEDDYRTPEQKEASRLSIRERLDELSK